MAAQAETKNDKKHEADAPGPAGPVFPLPEGKVTTKDEDPEGTVIGEGGSITRPTVVTISPPSHKEGNKEERFAGKIKLSGKTARGYDQEIIVDVPQALTKDGLFHVFRSHYPDADQDGFSFEAISKEDAEKQTKEWGKEHENRLAGKHKGKK